MERDFMGLNSKDSVVVVKEEATEGFKESVSSRSPFSVQVLNDAKQAVPVSMSHPFYMTQFGGAPVKLHGGADPSVGSFLAGTTEPWYKSKTTCAPTAQLTIFYGGMVNVYDEISPEKAQAIMLLAGNSASATVPQPRAQSQMAQTIKPVSSPMSVSSHPPGPANKDEGAKAGKGSVAPVSSLEQVMQSAVPQARKASLARFLEKRKERAMSSAPYNVIKDSVAIGGGSSMNAVEAAGDS